MSEELDKPSTEPIETPPVETPSVNDDQQAEIERLKAEKLKAEEVAENYKREAQKYRDKEKEEKAQVFSKEKPETSNSIRNDFLSKREDVIDEMKEEINNLEEAELRQLQDLLEPAVEKVFQSANRSERYVAKGEIQRVVRNLIDFAKKDKTNQQELEENRKLGRQEAEKKEQAGLGGHSKPGQDYSDEVQKLAEEKDWELEATKQILEKRRAREAEYAPSRKL